MTVIINNMAMPQNCYECRFRDVDYVGRKFCVAHPNYIDDERSGRLETCPLDEAQNVDADTANITQKALEAGKRGEEVRFYIGGRKFAVRELAQ